MHPRGYQGSNDFLQVKHKCSKYPHDHKYPTFSSDPKHVEMLCQLPLHRPFQSKWILCLSDLSLCLYGFQGVPPLFQWPADETLLLHCDGRGNTLPWLDCHMFLQGLRDLCQNTSCLPSLKSFQRYHR